jgi:response regulator RpfG family c-di-GMP phosphodiesterase
MKAWLSSLRVRIAIIVIFAVLPLVGLFLYHHLHTLRGEKDQARRDLLALTARVSTWQEDQLRGTRQLFQALAATPEVFKRDGPALSRLLASLLKQQQCYVNLAALRADGLIFASGLPVPRDFSAADRHYVQEALKRRDLSAGELIVGRVTGKATLNVAYPVLDPKGRTIAILVAALSLDWIQEEMQAVGLANGCQVSLLAADGTVMAHYPQARQWIGKNIRDTAIFKLLKAEKAREGLLEPRGKDGRDQIYAFSRMGEGPMAGYVYARMPLGRIYQAANRVLAINLLTLAGVTLLALAGAWGFGYLFVMRQVNELLGATRRIKAGEFSALPLAAGVWSGELGQLAHAFGDMAAALGLREELHCRDRARLERQSVVRGATNQIFHGALTCDTEEDLGRTCLQVIEAITGSAFGFIGLLNSQNRLDTLGISDPGWAACRITDENVPRLIRDLELRGLFGKVLTEGRSLLSNDPATHPDRIGLPAGHPPLTAFLGVPLRQAGRTLGMIGLANKPEGYLPEDQEAVESLAVAAVEALLRKRAELEARSTLQSLDLLVSGIDQIAKIRSPQDLAQEICLLVAKAFGFRLVWLGQADPDGAVRPLFRAGEGSEYLDKAEIRHDDSPLGRGPSGRTIRTGVPVVVNDIAAEAAFAPALEVAQKMGHRSMGAFPLIRGGEPFGNLNVYSDQAGFFGPARIRLLSTFAGIAAAILENVRLLEETRKHLGQLSALRKIDMAISGSTDLRVSLDVLLEQLLTHLHLDATAVLLFNPHANFLEHTASRGLDTKQLIHSQVYLGDPCLVAQTLRDRRGVRLPDLSTAAGDYPHVQAMLDQGFVSYLTEPLVSTGKGLGVLEVYCRSRTEFAASDLTFLEALAGQAAIAIDNAALFNDLRRAHQNLTLAYDATLEGLARTMELRDYETGGHCDRVTEMTMRLGQRLGMTDQELEHLRRGALLHDIGKIGIPDSILLKPGPLTEEEWEIMRQHPDKAFQLLAPIAYLKPALDIPYCHHEKWDGSGYPRGLAGEVIPLGGRIFAIVDVWDALSSDRPYRLAWPPEKIIDYLKEEAGKHFDPRLVEAFLEILAEDATST